MSLKAGLEERVQGLALEKVDVIFVREPHLYVRLANMSFDHIERKINLIMVKNFDDLKAVDEKAMKDLGWVRAQ